MNEPRASSSGSVGAAMLRLCDALGPLPESHGFVRTRRGSRAWHRPRAGLLQVIHLHRSGSSYGAPAANSVGIRVEFFTRRPGDDRSVAWLDSDRLCGPDGRRYHLRFNAATWSTYDRCLHDLRQVVAGHGIPWFDRMTGEGEPGA